ncbi:MAG: hypothetical protein JWM87_1656, partial [Candidatus Eremiobacteraeota bacterium]|nr:hypothetical protein [Candidatus Eremiobacteraeota bacterium]
RLHGRRTALVPHEPLLGPAGIANAPAEIAEDS